MNQFPLVQRETKTPWRLVSNVRLTLWNPGRKRKWHVLQASTLTPLSDEIWGLPRGADLFELESLLGEGVHVFFIFVFVCFCTLHSTVMWLMVNNLELWLCDVLAITQRDWWEKGRTLFACVCVYCSCVSLINNDFLNHFVNGNKLLTSDYTDIIDITGQKKYNYV